MASNFCFNFDICEKNSDFSTNEQATEQKEVQNQTKARAEFLNPSLKELEVIFKENYEAESIDIAGFVNEPNETCRLVHLSEAYVENFMRNSEEYSRSATHEALESNTDLIPSFYEGGMKIWECSVDLVGHLKKLTSEKKLDFHGKNVLELGCGAGLPGIYAWLNGASVYFQDYNAEVLKLFTIPNVALNANSENPALVLESVNHCKFLSGDWEMAMQLLEPMSFDFILTSETIYNIDVQKVLYKLIEFSLKPSGVAFVAAKSYYFGVGGGTDQFVELVEQDGVFDISKVATFTYGVRRGILLMEKKEKHDSLICQN